MAYQQQPPPGGYNAAGAYPPQPPRTAPPGGGAFGAPQQQQPPQQPPQQQQQQPYANGGGGGGYNGVPGAPASQPGPQFRGYGQGQGQPPQGGPAHAPQGGQGGQAQPPQPPQQPPASLGGVPRGGAPATGGPYGGGAFGGKPSTAAPGGGGTPMVGQPRGPTGGAAGGGAPPMPMMGRAGSGGGGGGGGGGGPPPPGGTGPPGGAPPGGVPPSMMGGGGTLPPSPSSSAGGGGGGGGGGRPPPPSGPGGKAVQFYSTAGAVPTPSQQPQGPPTAQGPRVGGAPPGDGGVGAPLAQQFQGMSMGGGAPAPGGQQFQGQQQGQAYGQAVGPAGYPQQGQGQQGQPQSGAYGAGAGQVDASRSMGGVGANPQAAASNQTPLPSINEVDMSIQCDSSVMQMTVGEMPNSASLHTQSKIPLGVVIAPMAHDMDAEDGGLDVVNFGAQGIIRCKRCRTYINPFVSWLNNGRQWRCNVCGMVNDVPSTYFCHLDNGRRRDRDERPELCCGSVEMVAPAEYMVRPPQPPVYMFVIDVGAPSVASGMLKDTVEAIKQSLDKLPGGERTEVGFITFDSSVHFYNLKSSLSMPQMLVVSDLSDPFVPCPDDLLVNLSESRSVVETLLENMPQMFASNRSVDCCVGSAISLAAKVMGSVGGKMVVLCSSLPAVGDAKLRHRENPRVLGTDKEFTLLKAEEQWYQTKAVELSKLQIAVDTFLFSSQYTDVATLSNLSKYTAGQLSYYPSFHTERDGDKFRAELSRVLTRPTAFEAVMRVRATRGLRITNLYGNYFIRGTDLLALPNCSPDSTFAVEFGYDDQILSASVISVQAALLYTNSNGERRIRVHNLAMPVQQVMSRVFESVNIDAVSNMLAKQALEVALKQGLDQARARIQEACVEVVRASKGGYGQQAYGAPNLQQQQGGKQQQPMPEAVQLLPLYCMALQKSVAFRGGAEVRSDERSATMSALANMSVAETRCFIYPRMFSIHDMPTDAGTPCPDEPDADTSTAGELNILLPPVVNLSAERLRSDGIFLLENALGMHVWVGKAADEELVTALFGVPSIVGVDTFTLRLLPPTGTGRGADLCRRVNAIAQALRDDRAHYLALNVMGEGDGQAEYRFFWHLVEDRASFPGGSMNYAEFMQHINRQCFG